MAQSKFTISNSVLKDLSEEVQKAGGRTPFLIAKKVLKDETTVIEYPGLKDKLIHAYSGIYYETDIPYDFWNEALTQVGLYESRKSKARKKESEELKEIDALSETNNNADVKTRGK